jgi:copper(I)-binding protein
LNNRAAFLYASQWEKVACGAFSDINFVSASKKRGFCRLHSGTFSRSQARQAARLCVGLALVACAAMAQAPALLVQEAWMRQVPGSDVAAVYLTLINPGPTPVSVVGIESPVASHAMIHETKTESGQARMRPHAELSIPPGQTVKLEPGGLHIMLHGLTQPVAVGQSVPITLMLSNGRKILVEARMRPLNAQ